MRKIFYWTVAVIAAFLFFLTGPTNVSQAKSITQVTGLDANSGIIKDSAGNVLSHDAELPENDEYTVNYQWTIPSNVTILPGDTLTFYVPENVRVPEDDSFTLNSPTGSPIGQAFIAAGSHVGTVTLNSYLSLRPYNRKGYIILAVNGTVPETANLAPIAMDKTASWVDQSDPTTINWTVDILANGNSLSNPVVTDTMSSNQTYVADSAKMVDSVGNAIPVTVTQSNNVVTFKAAGDYVGDLKLTYQSKTNEPTGAATFENSAVLTDDNGNTGSADTSIDRPEIEAAPGTDEPGTTEPETPGTTEPEEPGTTEPETPGTTEPEEPGTTEPEEPGTTEPEEPGTTEPEEPGTTEPETPGTTEPEEPGTTEPEAPSTDSEKPDVEENDEPITEDDDENADQPENNDSPESDEPVNNDSSESSHPNNNNSSDISEDTPANNADSSQASNGQSTTDTNDEVSPLFERESNNTLGLIPAMNLPSNGSAKGKSSSDLPQTGESRNKITLWIGLLILAVLAIYLISVFSRKSTKNY